MRATTEPSFAHRLVAWQRLHGRHTLPWQNTRDPYRIWLSEIMLQQTQVATVLDYYARFLARFGDVHALAAASQDEVFGLWSGLGYYSRARNLHRCAQQVSEAFGGRFPSSFEALKTLPGIGPSTAAAIASLCFDERVTILDGNVRRVVCRFLGFDQDISVAASERELWRLAGSLLPALDRSTDMPAYTQGLMDMGATVCLRGKPRCDACPLANDCAGLLAGIAAQLPVKTRKLKRSAEAHWVLVVRNGSGAAHLIKRPEAGIWSGLYALPMFTSREELLKTVPINYQADLVDGAPFVHVLTHKDMHLHPVVLTLKGNATYGLASNWFAPEVWPSLGLPAPVRKLLAAG